MHPTQIGYGYFVAFCKLKLGLQGAISIGKALPCFASEGFPHAASFSHQSRAIKVLSDIQKEVFKSQSRRHTLKQQHDSMYEAYNMIDSCLFRRRTICLIAILTTTSILFIR